MANQRKQIKRIPVRCAFCTRDANSKEHIWADWISSYLPKIAERTAHRSTVRGRLATGGEEFTLRDETKIMTGDPLSRRLRVVCVQCNGGWMSHIQNKTKPILIPFLQGEWPEIDPNSAATLAVWASMTTSIIEFRDYHTMGITPKQREQLRSELRPPTGFTIWVGETDSSAWRGMFNHFGLGSTKPVQFDPSLSPATYALAPLHMVQSTAFALGRIFFLVHSSTDPEAVISTDQAGEVARLHRIRLLHPSDGGPIIRPDRCHDQSSSDLVSRAFVPPEYLPLVRPFWQALD